MARKSVHTTGTTNKKDDLLSSLADELNKSNKSGVKLAYTLGETDDPSTVSEWISTGNTLLDLKISNRPNGGLPVGRIIEFTGLEGSGKSLLAAHIIAETQKKGGKGIFIDTENASSKEFWEAIGLNTDSNSFMYAPVESIEDVFTVVEKSITSIREKDENILVTIVVDSIAGATTLTEQESKHGTEGYGTDKARIISKAMRKITNLIGKQRILLVFTNQLRENLKAAAFGEKWVVPGGKSIPFHASVRVRLNNLGKLKDGETVIGNKCKAVVVKNRMGPPHGSATFNLYYDSGIQNYASWIDFLLVNKLITGDKRCYKYKADDGTVHEFSAKKFVDVIIGNQALKDEVYKKICDLSIKEYKNDGSNSISDENDVIVSTDDEAVSDDE